MHFHSTLCFSYNVSNVLLLKGELYRELILEQHGFDPYQGHLQLQSMGRKELDATSLSRLTFMHWRRKWQPTPVFLPGEPQGRGSLVGCCLWGHTDSDMTEAMQQQGHLYAIFKKYVFQCYMIQGG